ncbi:MAG: rRNA adenine dimethyltransferase family protein [Ilumatobacteraceae bacterium]
MHTRAGISELLHTHGLAARRDLGQNFVVDPNTVRRIARLAAVGVGDSVVEIGAGFGSLTLALAETGATVVAVELDRGIVAVLRDVMAGHPNVRVVEGDALRIDWQAVLADVPLADVPLDDQQPDTQQPGTGQQPGIGQRPGTGVRWVLVANLPYNVATPLVCDLLDGVPAIERMLVMVQREVGERMCAAPRTAAYGAVSVKVAYWSTSKLVGFVPASVFLPRPNVESALVEIRRREVPAVDVPADKLFHLVRTAFGQRRKMLRRSLAGVVTPEAFEAAGIDPQRRPEELGIVEWGALTAAWDGP